MPNTDATRKQGRSMDYSQLLSFKKKYMTIQQQNAKNPQGDQKQKHAFNSDRLGGGGSENGASWYYLQPGNTLIYQQFFGSETTTSPPQDGIDPRITEFIGWNNDNNTGTTVLSFIINSTTATEISFTIKQRDDSTDIITTTSATLPLEIITDPGVDISDSYYLNNFGGVITATTTSGFTRYYSNNQFFTNDDIQVNMMSPPQ
jgi:hypothetical protein